MNKRPHSITLTSWIFIAAGCIGLIYHFLPQHIGELKAQHSFEYELIWVSFVRILAVVCGVFMLRGFNWARWLLVVWIAYQVIRSAFHSPLEVVMHCVLFCTVAYLLFRPQATRYFRHRRAD